MNITSLVRSVGLAIPNNERPGIVRTEAGEAEASTESHRSSRLSTAKALMQNYSLENISRRELLTLGDKLYDSGVISGEQRLELTAPYRGILSPSMENITDLDEKRNFLADVNHLLEYTKKFRPEDGSSIAYLQRVSDWTSSLAEIGRVN